METKVEDALIANVVGGGSIDDVNTSQEMYREGPQPLGGADSGTLAVLALNPNTECISQGGNGDITIVQTKEDDSSSPSEAGVHLLSIPQSGKARFAELLQGFQALADSCVVTLHLELRVHSMYFADLTMREGSFFVDDKTQFEGLAHDPAQTHDRMEPEPYVLQLNADLAIFEDLCTRTLPRHDALFVFDGMSLLLTHYFVANIRYIRQLSRTGAQRMIQSIRAIHQHLLHTALCRDLRLDHARRYYEMFLTGSDKMIKDIADDGPRFTLEEYQAMLELMYDFPSLEDRTKSENLMVAQSGARAMRRFKEALRKLNELMRES
jgi:hypothetical protein